MRFSHLERLLVCLILQFGFAADRVSQDGVDERSAFLRRERNGLENRGVFRRLKKKELVEAQSKQIARIVVEMSGAELANPEIEQRQIPQRAVEQLGGEGAIR